MSQDYDGQERRHGVSNDEISKQLDELRTEIKTYVIETFVTKAEFTEALSRQTGDITRTMSATLNAFIKDSIREIFSELYIDQRKQDRAEMIENFVSVVRTTSRVADILRPILMVGSVLFGLWITGNA